MKLDKNRDKIKSNKINEKNEMKIEMTANEMMKQRQIRYMETE